MYHAGNRLTWFPIYLLVLILLIRKKGIVFALFIALACGLSILLSDQAAGYSKTWFMRLRPCQAEAFFHGNVHLLNQYCGGLYGFVSSHAANFWGLWALLFITSRKWISMGVWAFFALAVLSTWQRIYAGVHYPADVFFGGLLGIAIGFGLGWIFTRFVASRIS